MSKKKSSGGMGFRNVHDFNVALLGKQGWRLLHFAEKLVSRVYKARYYPHRSFFNAKLQLVFWQQDKERIHIAVMVCWMIWKHRNELVWNQHRSEITEAVESTYSILSQWDDVQDRTFD